MPGSSPDTVDADFCCLNNTTAFRVRVCWERTRKKREAPRTGDGNGKKFRPRQLPKQARGNHRGLRTGTGGKRKEDLRSRSLGYKPGSLQNHVLVSHSDAILPELTQDLKWDRELYKTRKDLAGFFAWGWD
jgi:hypothetical protein